MNRIKKSFLCIMICALIVSCIPMQVRADSGKVIISVTSTTVAVDGTVTVTATAYDNSGSKTSAAMVFSYDAGKLSYVSCDVGGASDSNGKVTVTAGNASVKFKATAAGKASVTVSATDSAGNSLTAAGVNITVSEEGTVNENQSPDNSLKSLTLSEGTLSPDFKYSVTKYTATVGGDVENLTVNAKTSNDKAEIVSITGNENLQVGENTIKITVKAENGAVAVYTIVVTKEEAAPSDENQNSEENKDEESDGDSEQSEGEAKDTQSESENSEDDDELTNKEQLDYLQKSYNKLYENYQDLQSKYRKLQYGSLIVIVILLIIIINLFIFGRMRKDGGDDDEDYLEKKCEQDSRRAKEETQTKKDKKNKKQDKSNEADNEEDEDIEFIDFGDM